jgi:hypothetical protein
MVQYLAPLRYGISAVIEIFIIFHKRLVHTMFESPHGGTCIQMLNGNSIVPDGFLCNIHALQWSAALGDMGPMQLWGLM